MSPCPPTDLRPCHQRLFVVVWKRIDVGADWTDDNYLSRQRLSLSGHVARLDDEVPNNTALHLMTDMHCDDTKSDESWRRSGAAPQF